MVVMLLILYSVLSAIVEISDTYFCHTLLALLDLLFAILMLMLTDFTSIQFTKICITNKISKCVNVSVETFKHIIARSYVDWFLILVADSWLYCFGHCSLLEC